MSSPKQVSEFISQAKPGEIRENIKSAYPAIALGHAKLVEFDQLTEPPDTHIKPEHRKQEEDFFWSAYAHSISVVEEQLEAMANTDRTEQEEKLDDVFKLMLWGSSSTQDILDKNEKNIPDTFQDALNKIRNEGKSAVRALYETAFPTYQGLKSSGEENFIRTAQEVRCFINMFFNHYDPSLSPSKDDYNSDDIIFASTMAAGDVYQLIGENGKPLVKGICLDNCSQTSHAAIAARSVRIPLCWTPDVKRPAVKNGQRAIIDGKRNGIIIGPSDKTWDAYKKLEERYEQDYQALVKKTRRHRSLKSLDGQTFKIAANADTPQEANTVPTVNPNSLGLIRTENYLATLSMDKQKPSVEEWHQYISQMVENSKTKELTFRLPEIKDDKKVPGITPDKVPEIWADLMLATLKYRNDFPKIKVNLMPPMIADGRQLNRLQEELNAIAEEHNLKSFDLGTMGESPSFLDEFEAGRIKASFVSVGSNDLIASLLGIDRYKAQDDANIDPTKYSVLKNMARFIAYQRTLEKPSKLPVSICGNIASQPENLALLSGMGYRGFSVPIAMVPVIKTIVPRMDTGQHYIDLSMTDPRKYQRAISAAQKNDKPDNAWVLLQRILVEEEEETRLAIRNTFNREMLGIRDDSTIEMHWTRNPLEPSNADDHPQPGTDS